MDIFLISGTRGSGKTTCCRTLAASAAAEGIACVGCLEIASRGENGIPWEIMLERIPDGCTQPAALRPRNRPDIPFTFFDPAFDEFRFYIENELSERREHRPQVCIIDEIGPLEMGSKGGHYALLRDLLENPALWCATLILTVRPALADVLSEYITAILDTSERMRVQKNTGDDHSKRKGLGVRRFNLEATSVRSIISEILARAQIQLSNLSPI